MNVKCPGCEGQHDIEEAEPSLLRPDLLFSIPPADRAFRAFQSNDACVIRDADDRGRQYFIRVLLPFSIAGLDRAYSWGVWVKVAQDGFHRVQDLWDNPDHASEPFPGTLANELHSYPASLGLRGRVVPSRPDRLPSFFLDPGVEHPLVVHQYAPVSPGRVVEWLQPVYHPSP